MLNEKMYTKYLKMDEYLEKEGKIMYPLIYDKVACSFFKKYPKYLRKFLNKEVGKYFEIDFEDEGNKLFFSDTKIPVRNKYFHQNKLDFVLYVKTENCILNIEFNTEEYSYVSARNYYYGLNLIVSTFRESDKYSDIKNRKVIQLNINGNKKDNKQPEIVEDVFNLNILPKKLRKQLGTYKIVNKNIAYYENLYYNDVKEVDYWLLIMNARNYSDLYKYLCNILDEEDVEEFMEGMIMINKKAIVLSQEEEDYFLELGRKAAEEEKIEEAEREKSIEIAKKLLEEKVEIDLICKTTGLEKEEIEKLSN